MRIIGPPSADRITVETALAKLAPHPRFTADMLPALWTAAVALFVDPVGVIAQSYKETGGGVFGGKVPPEFCNPCGLKVRHVGLFPETAGDLPLAHQQFPSWEIGALAHAQHLRAYSWPLPAPASAWPAAPIVDPRYALVAGLRRPLIETFEELGGRWAPSSTYGTELVAIARKLQAGGITPPPTPQPAKSTVLFGVNGGGNSAPVTTRLADFGRLPCQRWYYGLNGLPATFNTGYSGGAPEKRVQVSFKWQPSEVNAGTWDARFDSYFTSAPADWSGLVTFWHEPNSEIRDGVFTASAWKNAQIRLSNRLVALGLSGRWKIAPNFTGPDPWTGAAWNDSWMMTPDQLHPGAVWTWDVYGNPYGGLALDSPYPDPHQDLDQVFTRMTTYGWWGSWGISEFNTPRRNHDPSETARVQWLDAFVQHALTGGNAPPKQVLLWEGDGVQWPQFFYTSLTKNWWAGVTATSI